MNAIDNQHIWSQFETPKAPEQVVFLGASNLSRSFPMAVDAIYQSLPSPVSIHAAMGFGRSYGIESGFFGKKFLGISSASIWDALAEVSQAGTIAFITDIGNDLGYEQPVEVILEWVERCVARLDALGAKAVITDLPIDVLRGLSERKFYMLRSVLFPRCRLSFREMQDRATELSGCLREMASARKMPIFAAPNAWYGFDPIHPRSRYMRDYWAGQVAHFAHGEPNTSARRLSWPSYLKLRTMTSPSAHKIAPSQRFAPKRMTLADGTSVALY